MKVMISSVRRGLEPERDALPGLIMALGHEPVRFEDFSAQPAGLPGSRRSFRRLPAAARAELRSRVPGNEPVGHS